MHTHPTKGHPVNMRNRAFGVLATAAIAGGGSLGHAHVEHTTRTTAKGCVVQARLFEDGSYSFGKVTVNGALFADTVSVEPVEPTATASFLRQTGNGPVTLVSEWPVNFGGKNCTIVVG